MVSDNQYPRAFTPQTQAYPSYYSRYPYPYYSRSYPALSYSVLQNRARGPRYNVNPLCRPQRSSAPYYYNQRSNAISYDNRYDSLNNRLNSQNNLTHMLFANNNIYKAQPYRPHSVMESPVSALYAQVPKRPSSALPIIDDIDKEQFCGIKGCACNIPTINVSHETRSVSDPPIAKGEEDLSDDQSCHSGCNNNDNEIQNNNNEPQNNISQSDGPVIEEYLGYV